mgnify:CR=1 FL=1
MRDSLNPRQQKFVDEYVINLNASQAYIRAGYASKTPNSVAVNASNLLRVPNVSLAIAEKRAVIAQQNQITVAEVVRRLDHESRTAKDIHARIRATELLAKWLGMFPKDGVQVNIADKMVVIERNVPRLNSGD